LAGGAVAVGAAGEALMERRIAAFQAVGDAIGVARACHARARHHVAVKRRQEAVDVDLALGERSVRRRSRVRDVIIEPKLPVTCAHEHYEKETRTIHGCSARMASASPFANPFG
jgi:hypothetical protein